MEFKKCSIGYISYGEESNFSVQDKNGSKYFDEGVTNVNFND